jgi:hypothetical protein
MKTKYIVEILRSEGASAQFYSIKGSKTLGFKEFCSKKTALYAYKVQKKLSKLGLAPKVYGKIKRVPIHNHNESTNWGFVTQKARILGHKYSREKIQTLVDKIFDKTNLKFWDCHSWNIGRLNNKYVCIDTGRESFDSNCNAWGNVDPGPKCDYCLKYKCKCEE